MNKIDSIQFKELMRNSECKICKQDNGWFFTIDFFATEFSTGIGSNDTKQIKQTWELIESFSDCFKFMMWGQEPSQYNQYVDTLHHEGKNILIEIDDVIILLKHLCYLEISRNPKLDFELKNLRNCQGIKSFFNTQEQFSLDYINSLKSFNGGKVLLGLYFPEYFQFPDNSLKNDFSKVMTIDSNSGENTINLNKTFVGTLTTSPNALTITSNLDYFQKSDEFEGYFELTVTQSKGCILMEYIDDNRKNVIELPIETFQIITSTPS